MAKSTTTSGKDKAAAASATSDETRPTQAERDAVDATGPTANSGAPERTNDAAGAAIPPTSAARPAKVTTLDRIRALLAAPDGATLAALCAATGWQSHSVRAALTGLRKDGHAVEKGKAEDGATVYRIGAGAERSR